VFWGGLNNSTTVWGWGASILIILLLGAFNSYRFVKRRRGGIVANVSHTLQIVSYGLILFVATMVLLLVLALFTSSDQLLGEWWVGLVMAVGLGVCSRWFSHRLHAENTRHAITYGLIWSGIVAGIFLLIALPNGTVIGIFGQWGTYLMFLGLIFAPAVYEPKERDDDHNHPSDHHQPSSDHPQPGSHIYVMPR
jgi:hypothetical protein